MTMPPTRKGRKDIKDKFIKKPIVATRVWDKIEGENPKTRATFGMRNGHVSTEGSLSTNLYKKHTSSKPGHKHHWVRDQGMTSMGNGKFIMSETCDVCGYTRKFIR